MWDSLSYLDNLLSLVITRLVEVHFQLRANIDSSQI